MKTLLIALLALMILLSGGCTLVALFADFGGGQAGYQGANLPFALIGALVTGALALVLRAVARSSDKPPPPPSAPPTKGNW